MEQNKKQKLGKISDSPEDYVYPTIKDYKNIMGTGFKVNEPFRIGWDMARLKNKHLGIGVETQQNYVFYYNVYGVLGSSLLVDVPSGQKFYFEQLLPLISRGHKIRLDFEKIENYISDFEFLVLRKLIAPQVRKGNIQPINASKLILSCFE